MNEFLSAWILLAGVQTAATLSPGPAFAMTLRNATVHGRKQGMFTAIGLGLGVAAHVIFVLTGFALLLSKTPLLFATIKYAGAAYLIYIGIKGLRAKPGSEMKVDLQTQKTKGRHTLSFVQQGFLTNLLNPKAIVFFTAVFAQFITPDMPLEQQSLFGLTCTIIEMIWFTVLTLVLTHAVIRQKFTAISHWIDRICGGLLIALGVRLALSKL